jgi:hypothetical protein
LSVTNAVKNEIKATLTEPNDEKADFKTASSIAEDVFDIKNLKDLLHEHYNFPRTIFDALSWEDFADLVGLTWTIPRKDEKYRVQGNLPYYVTSESAWFWQRVALIRVFDREFFNVTDFTFDSPILWIRKDEEVRKCIQKISKLVQDNPLILDNIKPYTGYLGKSNIYSKNVQKNLIIINKILKIIHPKITEYNRIYQEVPRGEGCAWSHFFRLYHESCILEIKNSKVLHGFYKNTNSYTKNKSTL